MRISIHAPTGGATLQGKLLVRLVSYFNPRSHGGSDGEDFRKVSVSFKFQSTLPRGERPFPFTFFKEVLSISIHAPTGGATDEKTKKYANTGISIHAPTGGATHILAQLSHARIISIHAPTGGATAKVTKFK